MVDDTPKKMRFMDAGLVVVPEFTKSCALEVEEGTRRESSEGAEEDAAARRQREVLPRLIKYLRCVVFLSRSGTTLVVGCKHSTFRCVFWVCAE